MVPDLLENALDSIVPLRDDELPVVAGPHEENSTAKNAKFFAKYAK